MPETDKGLHQIVNALNTAIAMRDWVSVESAAHRLRLWHIDSERRAHGVAAQRKNRAKEHAKSPAKEARTWSKKPRNPQAEALARAEADARPERRAQIEYDEARRVAQADYDRVVGQAARERDRYGTPQVDNAVREEAAAEKHLRETPETTPATDPFRPRKLIGDES